MVKKELDYLQFLKVKEYIKDASEIQLIKLADQIGNRGVAVEPMNLIPLIAHCYTTNGIKQLIEFLKALVKEERRSGVERESSY